MKIKITSDSTCDLGNELIQRYDIGIVPLSVVLGDKVYSDGIDITPQQIFDYVANTKTLPKTAACTEEEYAVRSGAPLEVIENLNEIEDEGEIYESIEDIWPDYPSKDDFFFNEEEY